MRLTRRALLAALAILLGLPGPALFAQTVPAAEETNSKSWVGRYQEFEDYLRTAEIVGMKEIGTGVTKPHRCDLAPGGPVSAMAWKPLKPGRHRGYWESYKSEIAAYELDKLLQLEMVPVTVERRIEGEIGAAVMWVAPAKSFKEHGGVPTPPPVHFEKWNLQLTQAKMFDNLIYNQDPNLGNWLVDPDWNLILIDHSRAFTTSRRLVHEMIRVDAALWDRMKALDETTLDEAVGEWLNRDEIRAILRRRDEMQKAIDKLVREKGEAAVFVR